MPECQVKNEMCGGFCTGYDGSHIWEKRMEITKKIECDECRDRGIKLEKFSHDIVNLKLGKPAFDKKNFHEHVEQVKCLAANCVKKGLC